MTPAIAARRLAVAYGGRVVVEDLDLEVPPGRVHALLGGNGAGKTTTLAALLGFVELSAGEVRVDGRCIRREPEALQRVAYLPENVALYPYLDGLENLRYFCALAGQALDDAAAREHLGRAGLAAEAATRRVATWSKGMRQKVGLAIAYARGASVMLLDEPTSGLDPDAAREFGLRIRAAAEAGVAVLMATHDLYHARQFADRIGVMRAGRMVAEFDAASVDHAGLEDAYLAHARAVS